MNRFDSTVRAAGKTATGIPVPAEAIEELDAGRKPAVKITIGSYSYRTTVASRGDVFLIPLSAENRKGAGVEAGDDVKVKIELDTEPRLLEVPGDFQAALDADAKAREAFEPLSYSRKQRLVAPVANGKTPETRERNIDKAIKALREGSA
jgi:hypothetical protein